MASRAGEGGAVWFWMVRSDPGEEQAALPSCLAEEAQEAGGCGGASHLGRLPGTKASGWSEDAASAGEMGRAGGMGVTLAPTCSHKPQCIHL